MTLVVAGYMFNDTTAGYSWLGSGVEQEANVTNAELEPNGIFIAADSTISTTVNPPQTLLSGFRKIYEVRATLWQPYFVVDQFLDYRTEHSSCQLLVAFAGSTLTAQHYLNSITTHLQNLHISHRQRPIGQPEAIAYVVRLVCESNPLEHGGVFDEDTYTPKDMETFQLTADDLARAIRHSLEHALQSAKKYKIDRKGFDSLNTPFVAGMRCPATMKYRLFRFDILEASNLGEPLWMSVDMTEIDPLQVAVLGMSGRFDKRAQAAYDSAVAANMSTHKACFDFLQEAIDEVQNAGSKAIDLPAVLKTLDERGVTMQMVRAPEAE
ncbi:hypothetical protein [Hydrogenophaga sp.]|uniref:hypothetical protein n=1 Tax=Hydrogenophaga sp. TaxID=1904254 RepID=UPI002FCAA7B3